MVDVVTFRDEIRLRSPSWLRTGTAERILYSVGFHLDGLADALAAGIKSRFPNYYSPETLPLIGRERRIRRGTAESDTTYASRLRRWFDAHRHRGNPYELLRQVHAYYAPNNFDVELVYRSGRRFSMDVDGVVTRDDITWDPDHPDYTDETGWARWWLFFHWPGTIAGDDGLWGDPGVWGDGGIWGSNQTPEFIRDLADVPADWNAGHCFGHVVLMPPGTDVAGFPFSGDWEPGVGSVGDDRLVVRL
jgi:hypothetical protein